MALKLNLTPEICPLDKILLPFRFFEFEERPPAPTFPYCCFQWKETLKPQPVYEKNDQGQAFWRITVPKGDADLLLGFKVHWDLEDFPKGVCFKNNFRIFYGAIQGSLGMLQDQQISSRIPLSEVDTVSFLLPVPRMADPADLAQLVLTLTYGRLSYGNSSSLNHCEFWAISSIFKLLLVGGKYQRDNSWSSQAYEGEFQVKKALKKKFTLFVPLPSQIDPSSSDPLEKELSVTLPQAIVGDALVTKISLETPWTNQLKWTVKKADLFLVIPCDLISEDQPLPCCLLDRAPVRRVSIHVSGEAYPDQPPQHRTKDHYFGTDGVQLVVEYVQVPWEAIQRGRQQSFCLWKKVAVAKDEYLLLGITNVGPYCPPYWSGTL